MPRIEPAAVSGLEGVYNLADNPEWAHLLSHFALREGFGLFIVLAPEHAGAELCRETFTSQLEKEGLIVRHIRLSLEDDPDRLSTTLGSMWLDPQESAVWVDGPAPKDVLREEPEKELWESAFAALNGRRNPIRERLRVPLIFAGSTWLQEVFREAAPDFWSIRDTVIAIEPERRSVDPIEWLPRADNVSTELLAASANVRRWNEEDPDQLRRAIEQLDASLPPEKLKAAVAVQKADFLRRLGRILSARGDWQEAERLLLESDHLTDLHHRSTDERLTSLETLAAFYMERSDFQTAAHYIEKAKQLATARLGPRHRETIRLRTGEAFNAANLGRAEQAENEVRNVLNLQREVFGPEHPDGWISRSILGSILGMQGKHAEAEHEFREILRHQEQSSDTKPVYILSTRGNLGVSLAVQSKFALAEEQFRKVRSEFQQLLGSDGPDVWRSSFNLAGVLANLGRWEEALLFAKEAEQKWLEANGAEAPDTNDARQLREHIERNLGPTKKSEL